MLLRVGRRRTAWESDSVDTIIKSEFRNSAGLELHASVYEIESEQVVRAVAEHGASNKSGSRGFDNIDLLTDKVAVVNRGDSSFEFTAMAHRELHFESEDDLRAYLRDKILPDIASRKHKVERAVVKAYVTKQLADLDPEWLDYVAKNGEWPK